jgi:hypothetical protein
MSDPKKTSNLGFKPTIPAAGMYQPGAARRPTTSVKVSTNTDRVQEAIRGVFSRFKSSSIDLDALIFFSLQTLQCTSPDKYESMHRLVRDHIMKNFTIHQGGPLRLADQNMYRLIVTCIDNVDG